MATSTNFLIESLNYDNNCGRRETGRPPRPCSAQRFPELTSLSRMVYLEKYMQEIMSGQNPVDAFVVQEARRFTTYDGIQVDTISSMEKVASQFGYVDLAAPYTPDDPQSFWHCVFLAKDITVAATARVYLSKTPEVSIKHQPDITDTREHNFGEQQERCVLAHLVSKNGKLLWIVSVHMPMTLRARLEGSRILKEFSDQFPNIPIVYVGDFNSFSEDGTQQMDTITNDGKLVDLPLVYAGTSQRARGTFVPFVDDPVVPGGVPKPLQEQIDALQDHNEARELMLQLFETHSLKVTSILDHAIVSAELAPRCVSELVILPTLPTFSPKDLEDSDSVWNYQKFAANKRVPPFISDHQAIRLGIQL